MDKLLQNSRYEVSYDRYMKTFEEKNKVYHMEAMESIKEENMGIAKTRCRHRAIAYSRKSYWNTSLFISIYITNDKLKRKGLVFPLDHYLRVHTSDITN